MSILHLLSSPYIFCSSLYCCDKALTLACVYYMYYILGVCILLLLSNFYLVMVNNLLNLLELTYLCFLCYIARNMRLPHKCVCGGVQTAFSYGCRPAEGFLKIVLYCTFIIDCLMPKYHCDFW